VSSLSTASTGATQQFGRLFSLLVSDSQGRTVDLSKFRVKFNVKKSGYQTPNVADILIYNLDTSTAIFLKQEFTSVILQAGYAGNFGTIFKGNIKQAIIGRESATDTFLNLICGDGDQAYNFSVVNTTLGSNKAGGSTQAAQLDAAINSMGAHNVSPGYVGALPALKLPRGKVMYGNARDYISAVSDTNNLNWSIQDGNIIVIPESTYLPNQAVILTTKTGLIGTPQQTIEGIMCKCLLNPKIKCHTRVQIDNKAVAQFKIDFSTPGSPANTPVPILNDGYYFVLVAEHSGDTRGLEWYTNLRMLTIDVSDNPLNDGGVQPNYGS
jgi:hypothetical protein